MSYITLKTLRYSKESLRLLSCTLKLLLTHFKVWANQTLVSVFTSVTSISWWLRAITIIVPDGAIVLYIIMVAIYVSYELSNTWACGVQHTHVYTWNDTWGRWESAQRISLWPFYPGIKSQQGYTAQHYLPQGSREKDLQQMDGLIPEGSGSWDGFLYAG